jgi:hypothetical protein
MANETDELACRTLAKELDDIRKRQTQELRTAQQAAETARASAATQDVYAKSVTNRIRALDCAIAELLIRAAAIPGDK